MSIEIGQIFKRLSLLKATTGVCEAHLHQSYKSFVVGASPSQTNGDVQAHLPPSAKLRTPPPYIPIGLRWNCSNDKRFTRLVGMSFTDPPGGLNGQHWRPYQHDLNSHTLLLDYI